jgi:hypothetical protein
MSDSTFADRINAQEESAKNRHLLKKQKFILSPQARKFAELLVRLYQNEDFKAYLEYEGMEISDLLVHGFEKPPATLFESSSFGEQMAFNKGRYYQQIHFKGKRETLLNEYMLILETEKNNKENV